MDEEESFKPICQIFFNLARSEKKVEIIKEMLCQWEDFEPYTAFKRLDRFNQNSLSSQCLMKFLNEHKIRYDEEIIQNTFIRHYDYDSNGQLSYSE